MKTKQPLKWVVGLVLGGVILTATARAQGAFTALQITGSPDSSVGPRGQTMTVTPETGAGYTFLFNNIWLSTDTPLSSGLLEIDVQSSTSLTPYWSLVIKTPGTGALQTGLYTGATRWPFQVSGAPGMDFGGNGAGYNQLNGWFNILELAYTGNTVTSFAVDFVQHGTGYGPGVDPSEFGSLRFNSVVPITPVPEPTTGAIVGLGGILFIIIVYTSSNAKRRR